MLDIFSIILTVTCLLSLFLLNVYINIKGKHAELLSAIWLLVAMFCFVFLMYNYAIMPFSYPKVTTGTITGNYYAAKVTAAIYTPIQ